MPRLIVEARWRPACGFEQGKHFFALDWPRFIKGARAPTTPHQLVDGMIRVSEFRGIDRFGAERRRGKIVNLNTDVSKMRCHMIDIVVENKAKSDHFGTIDAKSVRPGSVGGIFRSREKL